MFKMVKIRKGKISDAREILNFLKVTPELQGNQEGGFYTKDFVLGALKYPDRDLVLIAEENKKMFGFLMAEILEYKKYSFLCDIFVIPEFRKEGIASKLFLEYEKFCKNSKINAITAIVLVNNKKIHKWCRKMGIARGNKMYFYEKKLNLK